MKNTAVRLLEDEDVSVLIEICERVRERIILIMTQNELLQMKLIYCVYSI